ncbi:MAG TPA: hypothetical protein DER23_01585 [Clostridiales bacterium]|jgi:methionyl-tRNA formyltransferase|nr:hypothetical protein [Clostridiales bacterium]HCG35011.1 hypothetical protein [Clostridiales bacterium]
MKIVYLGYDLLYPALEALYQEQCGVQTIFTFPTDNRYEFNREVIGFAEKHRIPWTAERITLTDIHTLINQGCDAIVSAGYIYRIPVDHTLPMVNIHPSLLPRGRGPWPMPVTILRNEAFSGVTIHKVESSFDTGDILLQEKFSVSPRENLETLMQKVYTRLPAMIRTLVSDFSHFYAHATPQGEGTYWPDPDDEGATVTPDMPGENIDRVLRAFYGYPCYLKREQDFREIVKGKFVTQLPEKEPAVSFRVDAGYIIVEQ